MLKSSSGWSALCFFKSSIKSGEYHPQSTSFPSCIPLIITLITDFLLSSVKVWYSVELRTSSNISGYLFISSISSSLKIFFNSVFSFLFLNLKYHTQPIPTTPIPNPITTFVLVI